MKFTKEYTLHGALGWEELNAIVLAVNHRIDEMNTKADRMTKLNEPKLAEAFRESAQTLGNALEQLCNSAYSL